MSIEDLIKQKHDAFFGSPSQSAQPIPDNFPVAISRLNQPKRVFGVIYHNHDMSDADGTEVIDDFEFFPRYVHIQAIVEDTKAISLGHASGDTNDVSQMNIFIHPVTGYWERKNGGIVMIDLDGVNTAEAEIALTKTGITLTWEKEGNPTGNILMIITAMS